MADHKAGGLVRNAFSRKSKYLRRNSHESKWIRATPQMNNFARRPRVVHPTSFAPSETADALTLSALQDESPDRLYQTANPYVLRRPSSDKEISRRSPVKSERRHSSPVETRGLGIFLPNAAYPPSPSDGSPSPFHYDRSLGDQAAPKPRYYGLPANPKPGRQRTGFGKHKVVEAPQHKGWDEFRSPRASAGAQKNDSATSTHTPWPAGADLVPQPASQSKNRGVLGADKVSTFAIDQTPSHPPARSSGKNTRNQSNQRFMNKVHKAGTRIIDVYAQGPKGEGQKLWTSLRGMRDDKRELRRIQTSFGDRSPRTQKRGKKQKKQLDDIHAATLDFPAPKPVISNPLFNSIVTTNTPGSRNVTPPPKLPRIQTSPLRLNPVPQIPDRPEPLGLQRSPVIVSKPLPDSISMQAPVTGSMASTSSILSFDLPFTASRSVEIDSKVNLLKLPQGKNRVPVLNAAPIPSTIHKKGLPPRPIPAPGEEEPPELQQQEMMYKLRVGAPPPGRHVPSTVPPTRPAPVKGGNIPGTMFSNTASASKTQPEKNIVPTLAVGPTSRIPTPPSESSHKTSHFAPLDDRQTERPRKANPVPTHPSTKHRFADAFTRFFDAPTAHKPNKEPHKEPLPFLSQTNHLLTNLLPSQDRARDKHRQKIKQAISAPRPAEAPLPPQHETAAPPIPTRNPRRNSITIPTPPSHSTGAQNAPPVPPLPKEYHLPAAFSSRDAKPKEKSSRDKEKDKSKDKDKPKPWTDMLPGRKRADSGDSFACIDARGVSERYRSAQAQNQGQAPRWHLQHAHEKKHDGGANADAKSSVKTRRNSGFLEGFQVWRGPVEVKPGSESGAGGEGKERRGREGFEEEGLVPRGLEVRKGRVKEVRDTEFYRQVDSVVEEYRGGWI